MGRLITSLDAWPIIWPDSESDKDPNGPDDGAKRRAAARWLRQHLGDPDGSTLDPETRRPLQVWDEDRVTAAVVEWRSSGVTGPGNWTRGNGRRGSPRRRV